ncbi:uncharacterized protein LOC132226572 [Myotis daubentonii]|uniref:uncharacterized protein LOC132226572 n=1 Tax=Myotis daubentonii TaxID=98922 RepID=UPI002873AE7B|nr:uncharacterized protein LOC132226572 [Myotis daubentonii]
MYKTKLTQISRGRARTRASGRFPSLAAPAPGSGTFLPSPPPLPLPPAVPPSPPQPAPSRAPRDAGAPRPRSPAAAPRGRGLGPAQVGAPLAGLPRSPLLLGLLHALSVQPEARGTAERAPLPSARKAADHAPRLPRPPWAAESRARRSAASVEPARQRRGRSSPPPPARPAAAGGWQLSFHVLEHQRWSKWEANSEYRCQFDFPANHSLPLDSEWQHRPPLTCCAVTVLRRQARSSMKAKDRQPT